METIRDFDNAPVTQMVLTVSFGPQLSGLTMLDVADLYNGFKDRYPVFQQVPVAQPMSAAMPQQQPIFQFGPVPSMLPRALFADSLLQTSVMFQHDRLSFSWGRLAPLGERDTYPGHDAVIATLYDEIKVLQDWVSARGLPTLQPQVGELAYTNAFELTARGETRTLADIFTFYSNPRRARMNSFTCAWSEGGQSNPGEGHVNATVQAAALPDGQPGVLFQLLGLADLAGKSWMEARLQLQKLHDQIAEIFLGAVHPSVLLRGKSE